MIPYINGWIIIGFQIILLGMELYYYWNKRVTEAVVCMSTIIILMAINFML